MNSFRVGIFLCCVSAIFANGCNPTDPCGGTCDPDQVCVDGACVECGSDADCDPNEDCKDGTCETVFVTCDGEENCPGNQPCVNGLCRLNCNTNADCISEEICIGGNCFGGEGCGDDATCAIKGITRSCFFMMCMCGTNDDCGVDEKCFGGICIPDDECESDADCDVDAFCSNGGCFPNCQNDCVDGNACTNDACVDQACPRGPIPCETVADCPDGCNSECLGPEGEGICFGPF